MSTKRPYAMRARAKSVEETRRRILDAAVRLADDRLIADISLSATAETAGVSVQTVLRQFGTRARLIEAATEHALTMVGEERRTVPGDVDAAVSTVLAHYEARGDATLLLLAQEQTDPVVRRITDAAKQLHRIWVTDSFAPQLAANDDNEELVDLLVVATDLYTWKLLRRDRGLSRRRVHQRMTALVRAVLTAVPTTQIGEEDG
ncbi:MAG: TetR/AcrR family transcriptional regulator [Nocardioides sp.]|uniref:TetR/AcrR family transcriptional regulator n=1 Tax=Nocardioides sp. TaxID=35761 RepID=UPI0039E40DF9